MTLVSTHTVHDACHPVISLCHHTVTRNTARHTRVNRGVPAKTDHLLTAKGKCCFH